MPEQTKRKLLTLDEELSAMETELQSLKAQLLHAEAQVNPLQRQADALKEQIGKLQAQDVRAGLTHDRRAGIYRDAAHQAYCPKCLDVGKRNLLHGDAYRWKCAVCGGGFPNPDGPTPRVISDYNPIA